MMLKLGQRGFFLLFSAEKHQIDKFKDRQIYGTNQGEWHDRSRQRTW